MSTSRVSIARCRARPACTAVESESAYLIHYGESDTCFYRASFPRCPRRSPFLTPHDQSAHGQLFRLRRARQPVNCKTILYFPISYACLPSKLMRYGSMRSARYFCGLANTCLSASIALPNCVQSPFCIALWASSNRRRAMPESD